MTALLVPCTLGHETDASPNPPSSVDFAYFIDTFTDSNVANVPDGMMVIGTTTSDQRHQLTTSGRIVGSSAGLGPNGTSRIEWTDGLQDLFNTRQPPPLDTPSERQTFAQQILATAKVGTDAFPLAAEATPTSSGGYVAWTQDFEGPLGDPQEMAAAIIAVNWAGRTLLTPPGVAHDMQIVPVPASVLQKVKASAWKLSEVMAGRPGDKLLSFLSLDQTLSQADRTALTGDRIDLFSFMHLASAEGRPLIDGLLAQQYSGHGCPSNCQYLNCAALPGSLSDDTPAFYATDLPYAVQSAHDNPGQLFLPPGPGCSSAVPPFTTSYRGALPMRAGVYWSAAVDTTFVPSNYLTPTVTTGPVTCREDLDQDGRVGPNDLGHLLARWNTPSGDLDDDGTTDSTDLGILLTAWGSTCEADPSTGWVKVLVAENPPPSRAGFETYVAKIAKLAPSLEQIHLRWAAGADSAVPADYAELIGMLRQQFGSNLLVGFHPDNSKTSCSPWGCNQGVCDSTSLETWQCVLDASIQIMNQVNGLADGRGFDIFSIEQSYVEDVDRFLSEINRCLGGDADALPAVTPADPPVKFASVTGSYGGPATYGPDGYHFTYPQNYNLGKNLPPDATSLYLDQDPYFPVASAQDCLPRGATGIKVVDADLNGDYHPPKIPCFGGSSVQNVYTTTATGAPGASPGLAAAYVAFLMTQYPPISNQVDLNGSQVFMCFSGEPEFLGGAAWTLDLINEFHADLQADFTRLSHQVPTLFPAGGADPASIEFAIWNFDAILQTIDLP